MRYVKNIFFFLGIAFMFTLIARSLESDFLSTFLHNNIIVLLITLLAINTATSSLIISKLQEIALELGRDFKKTYNELKNSLTEQIVLIISSTLILILKDSSVLNLNFVYHDILFDTLLLAVFIYSIDILRDTGNAIFEIIKFNENNKKNK